MFYSIQRGYGVCVCFSGHSGLQIPCQIQREGQSSRCNVMAQYVPAVCTLCTSVKCILEGRKAFRHLGIISNLVLPWNCVTLFWRHYILYCLSLRPFFVFLYVFHFLNFILYMSRCCTFSEFLLLLLWCWSNALLCLCVWNINEAAFPFPLH